MNIKNMENDFVTIKLAQPAESDNVYIDYHTLDANNPSANGDYIGIWKSDGTIPLNKPCMFSYLMGKSTASGTVVMMRTGIGTDTYVVGYSQGSDPINGNPNISATVKINSLNDNYEPGCTIRLELKMVGTVPVLAYKGVANIRAAENGHWVGLWEADQVITETVPSLAVKTTENRPDGEVVLDDDKFARGRSYKIGYFTSGFNAKPEQCVCKHLASILTFDIGEG